MAPSKVGKAAACTSCGSALQRWESGREGCDGQHVLQPTVPLSAQAGGAQKKPPSHGMLKNAMTGKAQRQAHLPHASSAPPSVVASLAAPSATHPMVSSPGRPPVRSALR